MFSHWNAHTCAHSPMVGHMHMQSSGTLSYPKAFLAELVADILATVWVTSACLHFVKWSAFIRWSLEWRMAGTVSPYLNILCLSAAFLLSAECCGWKGCPGEERGVLRQSISQCTGRLSTETNTQLFSIIMGKFWWLPAPSPLLWML
jgi:hypothetical protein